MWLKQKIWTLGEDNRVYKLFIFSLSTEFVNFAKDLEGVDAFTENNCTGGVTLLAFQEKNCTGILSSLWGFEFCQLKQLFRDPKLHWCNQWNIQLSSLPNWLTSAMLTFCLLSVYIRTLSQTAKIQGELQTLQAENLIWICTLYWTTCKSVTILSNYDGMISVVD